METAKPPVRTILGRGIRGRCPRCGEGRLFERGFVFHDRCPACRLLYQRNFGDLWMFTNIMDRVPIFFGIVALFFGFKTSNWFAGAIFITAMVVPMIATIRHRQGFALALDYLIRVNAKDPSDEIHGGRELSASEAAALRLPVPVVGCPLPVVREFRPQDADLSDREAASH